MPTPAIMIIGSVVGERSTSGAPSTLLPLFLNDNSEAGLVMPTPNGCVPVADLCLLDENCERPRTSRVPLTKPQSEAVREAFPSAQLCDDGPVRADVIDRYLGSGRSLEDGRVGEALADAGPVPAAIGDSLASSGASAGGAASHTDIAVSAAGEWSPTQQQAMLAGGDRLLAKTLLTILKPS